jgi:YidC/Oxa1 family membrane protein insertase
MIDHNKRTSSWPLCCPWRSFSAGSIFRDPAEKAKQEAAITQPTTTTTTTTTTAQVPGAATAVTPVTRDQALASTPRLKIDTPELQGSINLTGAQLDDLHLTGYRETIDPKSPTIVLLSPAGTPNAFFAEQGFVGATGTNAKLPD